MNKLPPADWLVSENTRKIMSVLEGERPGSARFVGGCVRNTIMGRPVDDIDIATQILPKVVMTAMKAAGIRVVPTGIEHGTVTAILGDEPFEITTLRRDVETDGRRAVVAFTEDWREDAERRDFRLNALYADPDGTVHDPVGGGIEDALYGRVIFIGDGDQRLREDYLRILRFFRFNAWYGAGIDEEGLASCTRQKDGLSKIAAERIWKEFKKLLAAPQPADVVCKMEESGVLECILPWTSGTAHFVRVADLTADATQRFMALLPCDLEVVSQAASALRLSNKERARLETWAKFSAKINPASQRAEARAFIYHYGAQAFEDAIALHPGAAAQDVKNAAALAASWDNPKFPLGGDDALALGLKGQAIGAALRAAETDWIKSDFSLSREALLERLAKFRS